MSFPRTSHDQWRAQVDKDLAGAPFDETLVMRTPEGLSVLPLYTEGPGGGLPALDTRGARFRACVKPAADATPADVQAEVDGGADAIWLSSSSKALASIDPEKTLVVLDVEDGTPLAALEGFTARAKGPGVALVLGADPLAGVAAGRLTPADLGNALAALAPAVRFAADRLPRATVVCVSTLPYHDAGADAADEIAIALSTGAAYLRALLAADVALETAARAIALRVASGRDTFGELCKLRALRLAWGKVLAASGVKAAPHTLVHAVCSARTIARKDPWVNMLRVTTEVFAAVLGGADLVTPAAYDQALGAPSALGRRVARNTCLVLREESSLGRVHDPAAGSYYFETWTDALAREAWRRFQALESEGGIEPALGKGRIRERLDAAWRARRDGIEKKTTPILGVSAFPNPDEKPSPAAPAPSSAASPIAPVAHRDAEPFE